MHTGKGKFYSTKNNRQYIFHYRYEKMERPDLKMTVYHFWIIEDGNIDSFQPMLKIYNDQELQLRDLFPPPSYLGRGISIAFVLKAKEIFGKRIISSSNKFPATGEMRKAPAEKYLWEPLRELGLAGYDNDRDIYYTI